MRAAAKSGRTQLHKPDAIQIDDLEMMAPTCSERFALLMSCCSVRDVKRSYLYVRENSLEFNYAYRCCCCLPGFLPVEVFTGVWYFDRKVFKTSCMEKFCMCASGDPSAEIVEPGCMCCCVHCACEMCLRKKVVVIPYQRTCCCCENKVNGCHNCCRLCGPPSGNPLVFKALPQAKDAELYCAKIRERMATPPGQDEMEEKNTQGI